jgi:hypothetical protein
MANSIVRGAKRTLVAVAVAALGAGFLTAPAAHADVTDNYLVSNTTNTSDPYVTSCSGGGFTGLCMYTSSDTGVFQQNNPYPMNQTLLYTLSAGLDPSVQSNWVSRGAVFNESQITTDQPGGFVQPGSNHLWAPDMAVGPNGSDYLYEPDISDNTGSGPSNSSKIAVAVSSSPLGGFTYLGKYLNINGYASDPDVFKDADGNWHVAYADHDFGTCGGISIAGLNSSTMSDITTTPQQIQINGIGVLGSCNSTTPRPYEEGPQIYVASSFNKEFTSKYLMMVAAKPDHVPAECAGFGQPGTDHEVLAWATSDNVAGPYTYQGVLMCGSYTEWTNQGSLVPIAATNGGDYTRLVLFYHDGPMGQPNRRVHAACVWHGPIDWSGSMPGRTVGQAYMPTVTRDVGGLTTTFSQCMAGVSSGSVGLLSEATGHIVCAENAGASPLVANRSSIGNWEQFNIWFDQNNDISFQAAVNGEFVTAENAGNSTLIANRTAIGSWETFFGNSYFPGTKVLNFMATVNNRWVEPNGAQNLIADQNLVPAATDFDIMTLN